MDSTSWIGLATLATAIVGLTLVFWQLHEQRRAMRVELGNLYIQRYWQIDDDLLLEPKGTKRHDQHRRRYLRLFEDEFDVAALKFLDESQWEAWHSVLNDQLGFELVEGDLRTCDPERTQFVRLRRCLGQRTRDGRPHPVGNCSGTRVP